MSPRAFQGFITRPAACATAVALVFVMAVAATADTAEIVEYSLTIEEQEVNYSGRPARAVTDRQAVGQPQAFQDRQFRARLDIQLVGDVGRGRLRMGGD